MGQFSRQVQWDVKRSVAIASLFYFFYYGGVSCLFPFVTLYYRSLGLSATQTGILCGSKSLAWFLSAPLWLALNRRVQKTHFILGLALLSTIASNLSVTLVPSNIQHGLVCNESELSNKVDVHQNTSQFNGTVASASWETSPSSPYTISWVQSIVTITSFATEGINDLSPKTFAARNPAEKSAASSTTTALASTATTTSSTSKSLPAATTTLSAYKVAHQVLPQIIASGVKKRSGIVKFVSKLVGVKSMPKWKQRKVVNEIMSLLSKSMQGDGDTASSTTTSDGTSSASGASAGKEGKFKQTVQRLAEKLLPVLMQEKAKNEAMTSDMFVVTFPITSSLDPKLQQLLAAALDRLLGYKRNVRSADALKRSEEISNDSYVTMTTKLVTKSDTGEEVTELSMIESVLPHLTNNLSTFFLLFAIVIGGELIASPVEPLSDNSFYELLDELDSLNRYGRHRMASLLAPTMFGISISLAVYFSPCFISASIPRFHIHFYGFALLVSGAFIFTPFYPSYTPRNLGKSGKTNSRTCPLFSRGKASECRHFLLMVTIFLVGITQSALHNFLLWQVEDLPNSSELVYGAFVSAQGLFGIVAIILGRRILSYVKASMMIPLSLYCISLQLLMCSYVTNAWFIVPLQALNVFGCPFLWLIVSQHTNSATPWHEKMNDGILARTWQQRGLHTSYTSMYQGLAYAVGSVVSGVVYDVTGSTLAPFLQVSSLIIAVWGCFYLLYQCCCTSRTRRYSKLVADSDEEELFNRNHRKRWGFGGESHKKPPRRKPGTYSSSDDEDWLALALKKHPRAL
ncbi:unnamed protein product [Clavelina lepadiformis]|uniref:Major facilitator superfamily associated domain-containing protein n=1 Tax=Clavelina lepadiformis TaxID=159417 RepID=A0ABP0FRW7_CLALP